ncbi:hypothetical protein K3495_g4145 [Podosphaera aphanis]|nr:hypothetical protein K3495_g4145 [Podosphaera aphanis]
MLVSNDQENLVHNHQLATSKTLNQETKRFPHTCSSNIFSKTPLKKPLQDENVSTILGRKSGKNKELENLEFGVNMPRKLNRNAFVTPSGPRARAPLGMKTTNANANANALPRPVGTIIKKDPEKTQKKPNSSRRPKKFTHAGSFKLEIHEDESPLSDREPEYCPPKPKDLPDESDTFPDNCLNYSLLKPENLWEDLRRYQNRQQYSTNLDQVHELAYKKEIEQTDEIVQKIMEEEWTVADVPGTFRCLVREEPKVIGQGRTPKISDKPKVVTNSGPRTITSKSAVSALTNVYAPQISQPKVKPKPKPMSSFYPISRKRPNSVPTNTSKTTTMYHASSTATSKSTIGYTKGRKLPSILQNTEPTAERTIKKCFSGISLGSDTTITPERFTDEDGWQNPHFLRIFEEEPDNLGSSLTNHMPDFLQEDEEEFFVTLQP